MFMNLMNLTLSGLTTQQITRWGVNGLIIGLGSVFTILVLLIAVINLLKLSSSGKKKSTAEKANTEIVKHSQSDADENEIIAVITAAINSMSSAREGKRFAIKSYKRIGSSTKRSY